MSAPDQFTSGIAETVGCLIPGGKINTYTTNEHRLEDRLGRKPKLYGQSKSGVSVKDATALFWLLGPDKKHCCIELTREAIPFSGFERNVLKHFPRTVEALHPGDMDHAHATAARIASQYSFGHLLVIRYIRRTPSATNLWAPALVVKVLADLALMRYEAHHAASGFVFAKDAGAYLHDLPQTEYRAHEFHDEILLTDKVFLEPASYRYVDGKNAFYLVDRHQHIHGTLRCIDPARYSRLERASHRHLERLLKTSRTRAWIAYVGENDDVNVVLPNLNHLRYVKRRWRILDFGLITTFLAGQGVHQSVCDLVVAAVRLISDMRVGTSILIPESCDALPKCVGTIDRSDLGERLRSEIAGQPIAHLAEQNSLIGLLTSDGLTCISKEGIVLATGQIVDLSGVAPGAVSGGGRTQSCMAASQHGIVLKVSEDGPVTLYSRGKELLRLNA